MVPEFHLGAMLKMKQSGKGRVKKKDDSGGQQLGLRKRKRKESSRRGYSRYWMEPKEKNKI